MDIKDVYSSIESKGIRIDSVELDNIITSLMQEDTSILKRYPGASGTKDIKNMLLAYLSDKNVSRTDKGAISLSKASIGHLTDPLVSDYLTLTNNKKTISSLKSIADLIQSNGRVYPKYEVRDYLGRVYVSGFNYPGLSKKFRSIVLPEEGQIFGSLDMERAELVVLATMSGDERLQSDLQSEDLHKRTAAFIFNKDINSVTPEERHKGKTLNFAIVYGATEFYVAKELKISVEEASNYLQRYFNMYPKVADFINSVKSKARLTGESETFYGMKRTFEGDSDTLEKSAVSHAIQSTAGQLFNRVLANVIYPEVVNNNGTVTGVVYDSALISHSQLDLDLNELKRKSEAFCSADGFPLMKFSVDIYGNRWGVSYNYNVITNTVS